MSPLLGGRTLPHAAVSLNCMFPRMSRTVLVKFGGKMDGDVYTDRLDRFPVLLCLSVSVKWLAVKTASEMTYTVSGGALNSAQPQPRLDRHRFRVSQFFCSWSHHLEFPSLGCSKQFYHILPAFDANLKPSFTKQLFGLPVPRPTPTSTPTPAPQIRLANRRHCALYTFIYLLTCIWKYNIVTCIVHRTVTAYLRHVYAMVSRYVCVFVCVGLAIDYNLCTAPLLCNFYYHN